MAVASTSEAADESTAADEHVSFSPGAIVRVACERFVTYDAVEFFPGPRLNMILGPNGTGKSTVVCAIALGLGWKPSVLGRAKDVASYVKLGYEQGWVEIELQGRPGEPNVVVRRILFRTSNTSDWQLNGVAASAREIHAAVSPFNIEVGNLCTFLPQDRVADFACMTPSRLLLETQHAAGHADLAAWHARLIEDGHTLARVQRRLADDEREHAHLSERNAVMERDVRRYEERIELEKQVQALQVRVAYAEFREAKARYDLARAEREQAKRALEACIADEAPLASEVEALSHAEHKAQVLVDAHGRAAAGALAGVRSTGEARARLDEELEGIGAQERQLDALDLQRAEMIRASRERIAELESHLTEPPPPADSALEQRVRSLQLAQRTRAEDVREAEVAAADAAAERDAAASRATAAREALARLDTVRHQRLAILAREDRDTYAAIEWLSKHADVFERPVHEPVLVSVDIKRREAARAIETCLSWPTQRTFVCQTRADYDLFTHELIDKRGWRLNVVEMEHAQPLEAFQPPIPLEELPQLGFDAFALQCIEAPPDVLRFLCSTSHLHAIPIAFGGGANPEVMERRGNGVRRYIIGDTTFQLAYSAYGRRLPQTTSRVLKPLRNFAQSTDAAERQAAEAACAAAAEAERAAVENAATAHAAVTEQCRALEQLTHERDELARQLHEVNEARMTWQRTRVRLDTERARLAEAERAPRAAERRAQLAAERRRVSVEAARVAERLARALQTLCAERAACDVQTLGALGVTSELYVARTALREHRARHEEAERTLQSVLMSFSAVKEATLASKRRADARLAEADEGIQARVRAHLESDESATQLATQLSRMQAQLDVPWGVGPGIVDAYRARKVRLAELQAAIDATRVEERTARAAIERVEAQWLPELEALISRINERFSAAFARAFAAGTTLTQAWDAPAKCVLRVTTTMSGGALTFWSSFATRSDSSCSRGSGSRAVYVRLACG